MKSYGVTIQMKAIEQYVSVVLFVMLCKIVLIFESGCNSKVKAVFLCSAVHFTAQDGFILRKPLV